MNSAITIGGSEAAAACGLDPFRSRVQLWLEKTGQVPREEAGEAAEWGTRLEPLLAAATREQGWHIYGPDYPGQVLRRKVPEYPWLSGHCDGAVRPHGAGCGLGVWEDGLGVWKAKTAGLRQAPLWEDEKVPLPYVLQVQHYMALTGLPFALIACLIGGQRFVLRRVERDEQTIGLMLALEGEFVRLCEEREPPPPDGSEATDEMLRLLYPHGNGKVVKLTPDDGTLIEEFRSAKRALKASEAYVAELDQKLRWRMGDASLGMLDGEIAARLSDVTSHRLDSAHLKEAHPTIYKVFQKEISYRRLTLGRER